MEQAIDALQSLGVSAESPAVDKHPEKCVLVEEATSNLRAPAFCLCQSS
jgi:hypothetical protein